MSQHASGPARDIIPVTPSDTANVLPNGEAARGLYVEGAGDLTVITELGETRGPIAVADFSHHPLRVKKVLAATTATGIWALL